MKAQERRTRALRQANEINHPRLLELTYESELSRLGIDPAVLRWQLDGFRLITEAIADVTGSNNHEVNRRRAIVFWTSLYGLASLNSNSPG